jgi:hypothetical protein
VTAALCGQVMASVSRTLLLWVVTAFSEIADHRIYQVFMEKMARVPLLFIHEPASVIPVGFW